MGAGINYKEKQKPPTIEFTEADKAHIMARFDELINHIKYEVTMAANKIANGIVEAQYNKRGVLEWLDTLRQ